MFAGSRPGGRSCVPGVRPGGAVCRGSSPWSVRGAGSSPRRPSYFSCFAKKSNQKKATLLSRPALRSGCPVLLDRPGRLRNSPLRGSDSPRRPLPGQPALLGATEGRAKHRSAGAEAYITKPALGTAASSRESRRAAQRRRGAVGLRCLSPVGASLRRPPAGTRSAGRPVTKISHANTTHRPLDAPDTPTTTPPADCRPRNNRGRAHARPTSRPRCARGRRAG